MRQAEIAVTIGLAVADVQRELDRRIATREGQLARSGRLVDEVERIIDGIDDLRLRRELRRVVELLVR